VKFLTVCRNFVRNLQLMFHLLFWPTMLLYMKLHGSAAINVDNKNTVNKIWCCAAVVNSCLLICSDCCTFQSCGWTGSEMKWNMQRQLIGQKSLLCSNEPSKITCVRPAFLLTVFLTANQLIEIVWVILMDYVILFKIYVI